MSDSQNMFIQPKAPKVPEGVYYTPAGYGEQCVEPPKEEGGLSLVKYFSKGVKAVSAYFKNMTASPNASAKVNSDNFVPPLFASKPKLVVATKPKPKGGKPNQIVKGGEKVFGLKLKEPPAEIAKVEGPIALQPGNVEEVSGGMKAGGAQVFSPSADSRGAGEPIVYSFVLAPDNDSEVNNNAAVAGKASSEYPDNLQSQTPGNQYQSNGVSLAYHSPAAEVSGPSSDGKGLVAQGDRSTASVTPSHHVEEGYDRGRVAASVPMPKEVVAIPEKSGVVVSTPSGEAGLDNNVSIAAHDLADADQKKRSNTAECAQAEDVASKRSEGRNSVRFIDGNSPFDATTRDPLAVAEATGGQGGAGASMAGVAGANDGGGKTAQAYVEGSDVAQLRVAPSKHRGDEGDGENQGRNGREQNSENPEDQEDSQLA